MVGPGSASGRLVSAGPVPFLQQTHAVRTRPPGPGRRALRLVAFGSSTTEGFGASDPEHGYPAVMRRALLPHFPGGVALANHGVSGECAIEMDGRLDAVVAAEPDLVLWQTGSNDVTRPVPLERFERLTRGGIARLLRTGADLVLMDQQYGRALEEAPGFSAYRDALHRLGAEAGVAVFPRYALMRTWCDGVRFTLDTLSPDGTHMADPGYALLGGAVADWVIARA